MEKKVAGAMLNAAKNNKEAIAGAAVKSGKFIGKVAYDNREAIAQYAVDNKEVIAKTAYDNREFIAKTAVENQDAIKDVAQGFNEAHKEENKVSVLSEPYKSGVDSNPD